jgi:muconolactone delta-isomerase
MKYFNIKSKKINATPQIALEYMVDFTMPSRLTDDFLERVPRQRQLINHLMKKKKLLTYALSLESCKMWAIFTVHSETELMRLIAELPLTPLMDVTISPLTVLNNAQHNEFDEICLN